MTQSTDCRFVQSFLLLLVVGIQREAQSLQHRMKSRNEGCGYLSSWFDVADTSTHVVVMPMISYKVPRFACCCATVVFSVWRSTSKTSPDTLSPDHVTARCEDSDAQLPISQPLRIDCVSLREVNQRLIYMPSTSASEKA